MHRTTLSILILASASAGTAQARSLLINGSLELPIGGPGESEAVVGWTLIEPSLDFIGDTANSASFTNFANHTPGGDRGLWLRSFEGGWNEDAPPAVRAELYQDVPAAPGGEYSLSAWFKFEEHYQSDATNLVMEFLDSDKLLVASTVLDINLLNPRDSVWRQFSVDGVSVPGTAFVRARVEMVDGVNAAMNPQSAFIDDFALIPSPGVPAMLGVAGLTGAIRRRRARM